MAMASCGDDYNDWANPQTNPQEDAITIPGLTATAADAIDLANVSEDSVSTFTLSTAALPEGFQLADARVEVTPQGVEGATKTTFNAGIEGRAAVLENKEVKDMPKVVFALREEELSQVAKKAESENDSVLVKTDSGEEYIV